MRCCADRKAPLRAWLVVLLAILAAPCVRAGVPLGIYRSFAGQVDFCGTGATLRTDPNGVDACSRGNLQDFYSLQNRGMASAPDLRLLTIGKDQTGPGSRGFPQSQHARIIQASGNEPDNAGFPPRASNAYPQRNLADFPPQEHAFNQKIN